MLPIARFTDYLKLLLLALTVSVVTLLNQRQVAVLCQAPVPTQHAKQLNHNSNERKAIVYQKVCFEATPAFAVPMPMVAILPALLILLQPFAAPAKATPVISVEGLPAALAGVFASCILARAP